MSPPSAPDRARDGALDREAARGLLTSLRAERDDAALYQALATAEPDPERAEVLRRLAGVELRHAAIWEERLRAAGVDPGAPRPSTRVRVLGWLARRLGVRAVLPLVSAAEHDAGRRYANLPEAPVEMVRDERHHERVVAALQRPSLQHPPGHASHGDIAGRERWHRWTQGGNLRAAVFGVNDGLVSNFALIMGVAGATAEPRYVLLAGVSGLLAGAFSMAAGEYVSVRAQRELYERQIALERQELEEMPEEEEAELALIYRAKGLPAPLAAEVAETIVRDRGQALATLAREELGLDPENLGSPWGAALSSFGAFAVGALLPVLAYILTRGPSAFVISTAVSAAALLAVGAALSLFTGRSALYSAARMLFLGASAAAVTYLVGRLVGIAVH